MKKTIFIFMTFLLSFIACKGQSEIIIKYKNEKKIVMEKLDIKALDSLKNSLKKNKDSELLSNSKNKKTKAFLRGEDLFYIEQVGKKTTSISGNTLNGYLKKETVFGSDVEFRSEFYPDGSLKRTGQVKYVAKNVDYAIGVWSLFDKQGKLTETIEYDYDESLFQYKEKDVKNYINIKNLEQSGNYNYFISKLPRITINKHIKQEVRWIIQIYEGMNIRKIVLDGRTGEKLEETVNTIEK